MTLVASLGMYDWPAMQAANDRLWALIRDGARARGIDAPDGLTRGENAYLPGWLSPDLVLSQTCGLPFRTALLGRVALVGTPDYGLPGLRRGYYNSVLIAPLDGHGEGGRLVYNDEGSQSGWAAPVTHAAGAGWRLEPHLRSGSHMGSIAAVAESGADLAGIDAVTWRLAQRFAPDLTARVRVVGHTAPTPGLPLITALSRDPAPLFEAVGAAIAALPETDRDTLGICGIVAIPPEAYLAVPTPANR